MPTTAPAEEFDTSSETPEEAQIKGPAASYLDALWQIGVIVTLTAFLLSAIIGGLFGVLSSVALGVVLLTSGLKEIPIANCGVFTLFGERINIVYSEGFVFTFPWITGLEMVNLQTQTEVVGDDGKLFVFALESEGSETRVQMSAKFFLSYRVDPRFAPATLNITKKEFTEQKVQVANTALRRLGSLKSYKELMGNLKTTQKKFKKEATRKEGLEALLKKYGYKLLRINLTRIYPTDEKFIRAMELKAREQSEKDGEEVQSRHINNLARQKVKESGGKMSLEDAQYLVLVEIEKPGAKGIRIKGGGRPIVDAR